MKTAIGVFASLETAEAAVKKLLEHHVPPERISFLTRSEPEASSMGKRLQIGSGAPSRFSVLAVPGIGHVFVQGPDAQSLLAPQPTEPPPGAGGPWRSTPAAPVAEDDAGFFRRVLNEGRSVVVVRSDSHPIAAAACEVLDKLGLGIRKTDAAKSAVSVRQVPGAVVANFSGKIAIDDGCLLLRETVRALLDGGQRRILLNLERVAFMDSAGLGELVRTHAAVRGRSGQLTLLNPGPGVSQLLRVTKLDQVFEIAPDERTALNFARDSVS